VSAGVSAGSQVRAAQACCPVVPDVFGRTVARTIAGDASRARAARSTFGFILVPDLSLLRQVRLVCGQNGATAVKHRAGLPRNQWRDDRVCTASPSRDVATTKQPNTMVGTWRAMIPMITETTASTIAAR
jgi:hypothetical protein